MTSLDRWIPRKNVVGFYTDDKGRKRPITPRKTVKETIDDSNRDLLEYIKTLIEEYRLKLGVETKPRIEVNNRWKRKIAHVKFGVFNKEVGHPTLTVNLKMMKDYYELDPEEADKFIRFTIAHEVAHLWQREKYGHSIMAVHPLAIELEAHSKAEDLTGISHTDFEIISSRLEKKIKREHPDWEPYKPLEINNFDPNDEHLKAKLMTYKGKIYARVVSYVSGRDGRLILRMGRPIRKLPKSAKEIEIVVFDKNGVPVRSKKPIIVSREDIDKYFILVS